MRFLRLLLLVVVFILAIEHPSPAPVTVLPDDKSRPKSGPTKTNQTTKSNSKQWHGAAWCAGIYSDHTSYSGEIEGQLTATAVGTKIAIEGSMTQRSFSSGVRKLLVIDTAIIPRQEFEISNDTTSFLAVTAQGEFRRKVTQEGRAVGWGKKRDSFDKKATVFFHGDSRARMVHIEVRDGVDLILAKIK